MGLFQTATMTLTDQNGQTLTDSQGNPAVNLPVQVDTVNVPIELEVQGTIPVDYFEFYSLGWVTPVPIRGNYFVDQATGAKYTVCGRPAVYSSHLEMRVSLPLGVTP